MSNEVKMKSKRETPGGTHFLCVGKPLKQGGWTSEERGEI